MDGWLATRELHYASGNWLLVPQCLQLLANQVNRWLIDVSLHIGVSKTNWTCQIAPVGQVNIRQTGVGGVHAAHSTRIGTFRAVYDGRVGKPAIVPKHPLLHLEIERHVREHDVAKGPMFCAVL